MRRLLTLLLLSLTTLLPTIAQADDPANSHESWWFHSRRDGASESTSDGLARPSLFTGSAEMVIPIEVPRGTGGMQPSLALRYSSRKSSANVAMGWSIDLPRIERSMKYGADLAQTA